MAKETHYAFILAALERLTATSADDAPTVTVAAIRNEAVRLGLRTHDRRGVSHRVRSALQQLRERGRVLYAGPDQWGLPTVDEARPIGGRPRPVAETMRYDLQGLDSSASQVLAAVVRGEKPTRVLFTDVP